MPTSGHFTSEQARDRYLAADDVAMRAWPEPRRELDVATSFGTVHVHRLGLSAEIISGAGHGLALERPDLINSRILDFSRQVCP